MYLRWGEGDCLAAIDRYRMKDGSDDYIADNSSDIHKSKRNGEDFGYIDFKKATRGEIQAYYQGIVDKMVMDRDFKNNNQAEQNTSLAVNDDSVGNINLQGKEKSSEKVITLSNGHSILPTDNS